MSIVITIDGPTSAGKNSVGFLLSSKLNFQFIDSGSIYRVGTLEALEKGVNAGDVPALVKIFESLDIRFISEPLGNGETHEKILNHNQDVTEKIHSVQVSKMVPFIAPHKDVREVVRTIQRKVANMQNTVMAGRDIGSVSFADAKLKFYLDASEEVRAQRRFEQLKNKGTNITLAEVLDQMRERDRLDTQREESPLVIPKGAVVVDTSHLTVEQTVEKMLEEYQKVFSS